MEQATGFVIDDLTLDEPEDVDALRKLLLQADETRTGWACRCYGAPHIDVFAGGVWLDMISLQHGQAMKTLEWPNAVMFSEGVPEKLAAFYPYPPLTQLPHYDEESEPTEPTGFDFVRLNLAESFGFHRRCGPTRRRDVARPARGVAIFDHLTLRKKVLNTLSR